MKHHLKSAPQFLPSVVIAIGCLAMLGNITGLDALQKIGLATAASPYPKVFCCAPVHGAPGEEIETFASTFDLSYSLDGTRQALPITPEVYSEISGPYNRRNVYGAVLSYAPAMPPEMWQEWFDTAFKEPGTLRGDLGIPDGATGIEVTINSKAGTWILK